MLLPLFVRSIVGPSLASVMSFNGIVCGVYFDTGTSLLAFAALLLDYAQRLWPPLDRIVWLSPFRYFNPYELVAGNPLPTENLLVLWAIAMTGFIVAYLIISERDISR